MRSSTRSVQGRHLLLAGGVADPSLAALARAATAWGAELIDLRQAPQASSAFHWPMGATIRMPDDLPGSGPLPWSGDAWPHGAFLRRDVFGPMNDPRPEVSQRAMGWHTAVQGWLYTQPQVRRFNARLQGVALNKPAALWHARDVGLLIPDTRVSNHLLKLRDLDTARSIAKPVDGGGYCHTLSEALEGIAADFSSLPALVQSRLDNPELRVFVIGQRQFAFEVRSPSLDYRVRQDATLLPGKAPSLVVKRLRALMRRFGMNFGAADFKTHQSTGELVFLELNTSPMFARFDEVSGGKLCAAMIEHLLSA